jgi:alkylation response protein AidB-like acyl-CoA dehydrogenase
VTVDFGFNDEQLAFRDAVRDLLVDACPPAAVRAAWTGEGPGYDRGLWGTLGEMGVLGLLAPVDEGGLGLTEVDLVLVLEETGRVALPGPVVEHAAVAVPLLATAGSGPLDATIAGKAAATFAERASRVGWGAEADVVVVVAEGRLRLADPATSTPLACVDRSRRDVALAAVTGPVIDGDVGLALDRAALGTAAQQCGLAAHLIATTVEYTSTRRQFGVPVGSYQALKHHLADALLLLEHARPAVYRAAWSVATGQPTRGRDVSMAKVMADRAAARAARVALQCHGAIGYTWEHDLHLWLKRVWVLERAWGTTAFHRARVATAVVGANLRSP